MMKVYKGDGFNEESILDFQMHFKATETFQYMISIHFTHQVS